MRAAIAQTASRRLPAARRALSTKSDAVSTTFLKMRGASNFSKDWLSDSSTYPLFAVMAGGGALAVGIMSWCMYWSPDIRLSQHKKSTVMRDWS